MKRLTGSCGFAAKIVVGVYAMIIFLLGTFCVPCNCVSGDVGTTIYRIAFRPLWYLNNISMNEHFFYQFNVTLALYLILILTILLFCTLFLIRKNSEKQGSPVNQ